MVKIALPPEGTERDGDALPELTITPDTAIVAPKWVAVGATAMLAVACGTFTVYEVVPELNEGISMAPPLRPTLSRSQFEAGPLKTVTVLVMVGAPNF